MKILDKLFSHLFGQKYVVDGISIRVKKTKKGATIISPDGIINFVKGNTLSVRHSDLLIEANEFGIFVNGEKIG